MAYETNNLRPILSNSARHPPNNPQGILEPWTTPGYFLGEQSRQKQFSNSELGPSSTLIELDARHS
jgi:hypothetical protein